MSQETAIRIHRHGDADVLAAESFDLPAPGPGLVQVRHTAIGVNFVDVYHRTGAHALPQLPATLGVEAVGVVERVGDGVQGLRPGQRVAYAGPPAGAYASARHLPAARLIAVPDTLADADVAGALLRGITAYMLLHVVRTVRAGDSVLVHAAAGGLGQVLGQWGRSLGARMIGTVSGPAKAAVAAARGYAHTIDYRREDFVASVREIEPEGVDYAIDGIGGATLPRTLETVRPFGTVASIGQVAGVPEVVDVARLGPARSLALSCPGVFRFMTDPARYRAGAQATLDRLADGLRVEVTHTLPLTAAGEAHRLLERGASAGAVILQP